MTHNGRQRVPVLVRKPFAAPQVNSASSQCPPQPAPERANASSRERSSLFGQVRMSCNGTGMSVCDQVDGDRRRRVRRGRTSSGVASVHCALSSSVVMGRGQRGVPTGQTKTAATHSARAACWPCTEAQKTGMTQKSQQEGAIRRGVMVTDHGQEEWRCISPKRVEKCSCRRSHSDLARSKGASELFLLHARDSRSTFKYSHTSLHLLQPSLSL